MLWERKWNYIFNLFYAETNYQEEKRGFICILTVELVTSSETELPPCCVPKESVVPALGSLLEQGTRSCAGAWPLAAACAGLHNPFPCSTGRRGHLSLKECEQIRLHWRDGIISRETEMWLWPSCALNALSNPNPFATPLVPCLQKSCLIFHGHKFVGIQEQGTAFLQKSLWISLSSLLQEIVSLSS